MAAAALAMSIFWGKTMTIDFNRAYLSDRPLNRTINELVEQTESQGDRRQYLGASSIGDDCLRKTQYTWQCDPKFPSVKKDIFARGDYFEERTRQHLIAAGFKFIPPESERLKFEAIGGLFCGHADGIIEAGPDLPELIYPYIWEHKCPKGDGWRSVEKDGLIGINVKYAAQVAVYQFYLNVTNPALFSVVNADTCERLHFLVPFNAQLARTMIDRASTVIEATRAGELLPRAYDSPDDWHCKKLCPWRERCWGQQ
jgi:hypothetical protein